jgi:hypothetical protein
MIFILPNTLEGFEPGSSALQADSMTTALRRFVKRVPNIYIYRLSRFCQILCIAFSVEKKLPKNLGSFCNFQKICQKKTIAQ